MSEQANCIDETLSPAEWYKTAWYEAVPRDEAKGMDLSIRIHRACSWLRRAQTTAHDSGTDALDDQLVLLWIAFNSLYGRWDPDENHPARDVESVRSFLTIALELDAEDGFGKMLLRERPLAERLFDNVYLDHYFWRDLTEGEGDDETWKNMPKKGRRYLDDGRAELALDRLLLYRVYQLRCQLIHGGATHGGRLNRNSVADCGRFLHLVLDQTLRLMIKRPQAFRERMGMICYPPLPSP